MFNLQNMEVQFLYWKILFWSVLMLTSSCNCQNLTETCNRDWNRYHDNKWTAGWAMRMLDSRGKPESGILDGNRAFVGDYQECIRIKENESNADAIQGLFCIGGWINGLSPSRKGLGFCIPHTCSDADAAVILNEVDMHLIRPEENSTIVFCIRHPVLSEDPGAIVSITILSIFAAIVSVATFFDVFYASKMYGQLAKTNHNSIQSELKKQVGISKDYANRAVDKPHQDNKLQKGNLNEDIRNAARKDDKIADICMHKFVQKDLIDTSKSGESSSYDVIAEGQLEYLEQQPGVMARLLLSFSLHTNIPRLVKAKHAPGSFKCLHGIRFISMAGVVWGHSYSIGLFGLIIPTLSNYYPAMEIMHKLINQIFLQLVAVVDTFLVMSGFLVTYLFLKTIKKQGGKVSFRMMVMYYFHRYWRLTPVYAIVLMLYINLFHYMRNGPLMPHPDLTSDVTSCKDIWWRNLLYIQNLWPAESFSNCFGHAWYLAIDMQLYIMAPPFIILAYFYPIIGTCLLIAGFFGSICSNLVIYSQYYNGKNEIDFSVDIYIKPWTRANTYFIGMLLGVLVYQTKCKIKIHKVLVAFGWIVSISLIILSQYLPYLERTGCENFWEACHPWTTAGKVVWGSVFPVMYALGVSWIILACICGYGGPVDSFLSWRAWIPLSRLSYVTYLVHYGLLMLYYYGSPVQFYFTHYIWLYQFCGHMVISLAIAFIISLMFEVPMLGIEKVLLPHK